MPFTRVGGEWCGADQVPIPMSMCHVEPPTASTDLLVYTGFKIMGSQPVNYLQLQQRDRRLRIFRENTLKNHC